MAEFTLSQQLLMRIRKEYCGDNSAELARRISKDSTYVHRLFYPVGKKGRKGIGLEIMQACTTAFNLPPGFWEGAESTDEKHVAQEPLPPLLFPKPQYDEWTSAAIAIMSSLDKTQKAQMVAKMREYRQFLGPPRDGQALQVAG